MEEGQQQGQQEIVDQSAEAVNIEKGPLTPFGEMCELGGKIEQAYGEVCELEQQVASIQSSYMARVDELQSQIEAVQKEMALAARNKLGQLALSQNTLEGLKEVLIEGWTEEKKVLQLASGTKIVLSHRRSAQVLDDAQLLQLCRQFPQPPYEARWDKKKLLALVDMGAIPAGIVEVRVNKFLAIQLHKEASP